MPIKRFKPTSPGRRFQTVLINPDLDKKRPEKKLTTGLRKTGGRNNEGRITMRRRGGGHRQLYRFIDFRRDKKDVPAKVLSIEYDPNRTANIALVSYVDGQKSYIIAPNELKTGQEVVAGEKVDIKIGNTLPLRNIPDGTLVHNVELKIGKGAQLARSAGTFAQLMAKEGSYALLKLPSGEMRKIHKNCRATIGQVGNIDVENVTIGKAGRSRWLGRRPKVRGVAMNPIDHPMGGGEGKTSGGRHPCTPWGVPTKGYRTRKRKASDKLIIKKRK
jgi:large subunit ribosomal protein L2